MSGGWLATLATLVASALGMPLADLQPSGAQDAPAGQTVPEGSVDESTPPAEEEDDGAWRFDPARCDTQHEVEVPLRRRWVRHRVQSRETISDIAFRHGVAPWEVRGWNVLGDTVHRVKRGARLKIKAARIPPPREKIEYEVQEGDSWGSVARAFGATPSDLRAYNYPYRGKMDPGTILKVHADPILRDWIAATPAQGELVPRGAVGVGSPDMGSLLGGVRIPEGEGYWLRLPRSAYGTTYAVTAFLTALSDFRDKSSWAGTLAIGAMSGPRGGPLGHHKSHQTGRDLDVRLPRREGVSRYAELKVRRVDWGAAWAFVQALSLVDTQVIFLDYKRQKYLYRAAKAAGADEGTLKSMLQYPRGAYVRRGLVRHYPGHEKHFHIRFGCGPCEVSCTTAALTEAAQANAPAD
ncbi:MAG: penicillin-insensitive murein endopeptidase [Nannocystales bacterium]